MVDLHSHTIFSDGELLPAELIQRAEAKGLAGIALTDHVDPSNLDFVLPRVLALVGGLFLLLLPVTLPVRVVVWGFAVWLLIEAIQTIVGAVGLRRGGAGWLAWLLIGAVSLLFAGLLVVQDALAVGVLTWALAGWALVRGASALFAAWKAPRVPGHRAWLVAEGILAHGTDGVSVGAIHGGVIREVHRSPARSFPGGKHIPEKLPQGDDYWL